MELIFVYHKTVHHFQILQGDAPYVKTHIISILRQGSVCLLVFHLW